MSRPLSTLALQQFFASNMDSVLLVLYKINHADWATPFYFVNNPESIISNGDTYEPYPINMILPSQDTDNLSQTAELVIDTVDNEVLNVLRGINTTNGYVTIGISMIIAEEPDTVIFGEFTSQLRSITYDRKTMTGTLAVNSIMGTIFPKDTFNVSGYPGLWRA